LAGHLSLHPLYGAASDSQSAVDLQYAITRLQLMADGFLDRPANARASELLDPLFADTVQTSHDTRANHLPLEFAEYTGHLYHRLAKRTGAVNRLLVGI
jgi:hypothetical protein